MRKKLTFKFILGLASLQEREVGRNFFQRHLWSRKLHIFFAELEYLGEENLVKKVLAQWEFLAASYSPWHCWCPPPPGWLGGSPNTEPCRKIVQQIMNSSKKSNKVAKIATTLQQEPFKWKRKMSTVPEPARKWQKPNSLSASNCFFGDLRSRHRDKADQIKSNGLVFSSSLMFFAPSQS